MSEIRGTRFPSPQGRTRLLGRGFNWRIHSSHLQASILKQNQSTGAEACEFAGSAQKTWQEIGYGENAIAFASQVNHGFRAATVLFGKMQIARYLQNHCGLV